MNHPRALLTLLLATAVLLISPSAPAAAPDGPAGDTLSGEVLETNDAAGYTYLKLKTPAGETWAAINQQPVPKGAKVTLENTLVMRNFESRALKKTFSSIVFGNLQGSAPATAMPLPMAGGASTKPDLMNTPIAKATGANAHTVAEVVTQAQKLKDKPVVVQGKVVKYNAGIMGKNWIHLRDGSGKEGDGSNDVLVTTSANTQVGAVIKVSGTVHTDKDFGAGYAYKVLIEDASVK
jgi:hypothetical protein